MLLECICPGLVVEMFAGPLYKEEISQAPPVRFCPWRCVLVRSVNARAVKTIPNPGEWPEDRLCFLWWGQREGGPSLPKILPGVRRGAGDLPGRLN